MEGSAWYLGTNHRWTGTVSQLYWKETYWEIKDKDVWSGDMWMNIMKQDLCEDLCYCMLISTRKHSPWRGMEYWVGKMIPPVFVFSYPEYSGHLDRLAMMAEVEATQLAQWLSRVRLQTFLYVQTGNHRNHCWDSPWHCPSRVPSAHWWQVISLGPLHSRRTRVYRHRKVCLFQI